MKQQEINKLLDQYRKGIISSDDRRKLEQLSIEDDFVFDALEGMNEARNESGKVRDLDLLRGRLEKRVVTQKQRKLTWWIPSAAAAVLLIVGGMWLFQDDPLSKESTGVYAEATQDIKEVEENAFELSSDEGQNGQGNTDDNMVVKAKSNNPSTEKIPEKNQLLTASSPEVEQEWSEVIAEDEVFTEEIPVSNTTTSEASVPTKQQKKSSSPYAVDEVAVENTAMEAVDFEDIDEDAAEQTVKDRVVGDLNSDYSPERAQEAEEEMAEAAVAESNVKKEAPAAAKVIPSGEYRGMVTDNYGEPLIGASVVVKGTDIGSITDFNGEVELQNVPGENPRVVISYTGFISIEIPLTNGFNVSMQEGDLLSEVVVVGKNRKKKARSIASPVVGWSAFNEKVANVTGNTPKALANSTIVIEFNVGINGNPRRVKVVKGKDLPETDQIIELIKAEKWQKGDGTVIF